MEVAAITEFKFCRQVSGVVGVVVEAQVTMAAQALKVLFVLFGGVHDFTLHPTLWTFNSIIKI